MSINAVCHSGISLAGRSDSPEDSHRESIFYKKVLDSRLRGNDNYLKWLNCITGHYSDQLINE